MKKTLRISIVLLCALAAILFVAPMVIGSVGSSGKGKAAVTRPFHNGDIIFQTSQSGQSLAVSYATHSRYTHCGLLFNDGGNWFVYEAVGPVKKTAFNDWIAMGDSNYYVVRRLAKSDSIMTDAMVTKMRASVSKRLGIDYDFYFGWNDSLIYCSELVWKAYNESTGLRIGEPKAMKEFDLTHPTVQKIMTQRYGNNIPYDELMISPGDVFDSKELITVTEGVK